jgi:hypothetical protein
MILKVGAAIAARPSLVRAVALNIKSGRRAMELRRRIRGINEAFGDFEEVRNAANALALKEAGGEKMPEEGTAAYAKAFKTINEALEAEIPITTKPFLEEDDLDGGVDQATIEDLVALGFLADPDEPAEEAPKANAKPKERGKGRKA